MTTERKVIRAKVGLLELAKQLGAQMIGHRPADDLAAPGIQHNGEVQKAA